MKSKFLKPMFSFLLAFLLLLQGSVTAIASSESSSLGCTALSDALNNAQESKVITSKNGTNVLEITDPKVLEKLESSVPRPEGKKLVGVAIAYSQSHNPSLLNDGPVLTPQALTGYYLKNITSSVACGADTIRQSTYKGPATATMTVTERLSATWSTNTGISASVVSAELGFEVTEEHEVSDSYQIQVPSGKTYTIVARPFFRTYNFEVWYDPLFGDDYKAGSGYALKPVGVCFYLYE